MSIQSDVDYARYALQIRTALPLRDPIDYKAQEIISELSHRLIERGSELTSVLATSHQQQ